MCRHFRHSPALALKLIKGLWAANATPTAHLLMGTQDTLWIVFSLRKLSPMSPNHLLLAWGIPVKKPVGVCDSSMRKN